MLVLRFEIGVLCWCCSYALSHCSDTTSRVVIDMRESEYHSLSWRCAQNVPEFTTGYLRRNTASRSAISLEILTFGFYH